MVSVNYTGNLSLCG